MLKGIVDLPLHYGTCPRWLFGRMVKLGKAISEIIIYEQGQKEFLRKLSNPYFFQSLGCGLGFDWHSSGLTTTVCGALKEAINKEDFGIKVAGGKGKTSRKTPEEIEKLSNLSSKKIERLKYASRLGAKVDNNLIQDFYSLYHHCFFFNEKGEWVIIQQVMNSDYARRYHWFNEDFKDFIEPNNKICCDVKEKNVLDMTSRQSRESRKISIDLVKDNPEHLKKYFIKLQNDHYIKDAKRINIKLLRKVYEIQPKNYEGLIAIKGVGAKTIRSLALISNLIYGSELSWEDPVKYSFAHGGKDSVPFPVNKKMMDKNTEILKDAIKQAKLDNKEKLNALKRLSNFL